ncbi:hypothetical protein U9M48_023071 [Paspalum notatum var. saurae]|uniref:CASP-like protein n=1 Tax=Paspalum notatum var. saurae TaxID=547442 RepID=A0AAQ3TKU4_PASNO
MALSRTAWIAAGIGARLLMIAALAMTVQRMLAIHPHFRYLDDYYKLSSYTYVVAVAVIGMAGCALQFPVAVYLLFKSKRTTPSALMLDISLCADVVVTVLLASGVGAGFGATDTVLHYIDYTDWTGKEEFKKDLTDYYNKAILPDVFLLIGMVVSMAATVISARIRARATNDDHADDF